MTCQNLQNKLLNITVLFIWYLLQIVGEFKKNVTRQTWQALFHFGEYLFQSTRHFGECLKNMVSHTAPKSSYLKSDNHKIVTWNTNRPRRLYVSISFNLLFLYFLIFSLNCVCCHLFSADNISVFMYNFIHVQFHVIYIKSYLFPHKFPLKI